MSFRIIHIEDSEIQAIVTENILTKGLEDKEDFIYIRVSTLRKAIDLLDQGCLDIVLVDLGLPDSFGKESVENIRQVCPNTPIIVLTADDDLDMAKACVRAGADAYLLKSSIRTLPLIIVMAVERWELKQEQKHIADMYKSIVEDSPDWIVRFSPSGIITFANNSAILGMNENPDTVIGKSIDDYLDTDQVHTHNESIATVTIHNPHIEGKDMWLNGHLIQWRKSGIFDSRKKLIEIQAVGRDVTDQHYMMKRLVKDVKKLTTSHQQGTDDLLNNAMEQMKKTLRMLNEAE